MQISNGKQKILHTEYDKEEEILADELNLFW